LVAVEVSVGVNVNVGVGLAVNVCVGRFVGVHEIAVGISSVDPGVKNTDEVGLTELVGAASGTAVLYTAPTISRFTTLAAIKIAPITRRGVI
jgi:hypothetical protein